MGRAWVRRTATLVLAVAVAGACATTPKGPGDNELIQGVLDRWGQALTAKDIDALMDLYSEQYTGRGGKEAARQAMEGYAASGTLDNASVETANARIVITANTASVAPVYVSTPAGTALVSFDLVKEGERWMIARMDIGA